MKVPVYIGAESIVSSLGRSAASNYDQLCKGISGIALEPGIGWKESDVYLSRIRDLPAVGPFASLLSASLEELSAGWDQALLTSSDTQVIISSTKGELSDDLLNPFHAVIDGLINRFGLVHRPLLLSNACISGVLAINLAARMIGEGMCRHVVVLGADVISPFVLYGFQSLYAVSDVPCRPFDQDRKGVTLGDGCGRVVLSVEKNSFSETPALYLGGGDANDANHISGPSRTGEGLVRAVAKSLRNAGVDTQEIGCLNAHGTGTLYNDEMEAIAFNRLGLETIPLNSLKGYWGHTLGAAGLIETALCMQVLRNGIIPASIGFENPGTSKPLNVVIRPEELKKDIILKTASGFGGGNAALLITRS